ncbi:MAG TPA: hypothetical protein VG602_06790 [Actinomycetota bacterium]|nr:hypothetical protein [Actinomycetota bacterium]
MLVIGATFLAVPNAAAADPVRYAVSVESPGPIAVGTVTIRAVVSGGVSPAAAQPKYAAYHIRTLGPWTEEERSMMDRVSGGIFETTLAAGLLPNDAYRLEVRVWGDVPPYDPKDPATFARAVTDVAVDNPPPVPEGVQAASPSPALRIGWTPVDTADRSDFLGYRVLHRAGPCVAETSAYQVLGQVEDTLFTRRLDAGRYCIRVAAVRSSAVSGEILSPLSAPARVALSPSAAAPLLGDLVTGTGEVPEPPPAPKLPEPDREFSDARFAEDLPYDGVVTTQVAVPARVRQAAAVDPGPDPRQGPVLVAAGLILATASFLILRFLRVPGS